MIVVAGAGIGGLTLGCGLAKARQRFVVHERAPELRPAGAGIALSQNALRALGHLGLEAAARAAGQELAEAALWDWRGRALVESRLRETALGGTVAMARTSLQGCCWTPSVGRSRPDGR
jgi:2-polyprenyl-6-methoxyphenol hydroxylase-like FAD-dependent oxidoreductase